MPQDQANLQQLLKSSFPILVVHTHDESRVVDVLRKIVDSSLSYGQLYVWSAHAGLETSLEKSVSEWRVEGLETQPRRSNYSVTSSSNASTTAPEDALKYIKENVKSGVVLLPDFHAYLTNPAIVRMVKEIAQDYARRPVTLVFVSYDLEVPPELQRLSVYFDISVPDAKKIQELLNEEVQEWRQKNGGGSIKTNQKALDLLTTNLIGLTESDARRLIRGAIYDDHVIDHSDIEEITQTKYRMISGSGALHFEYDTASFSDVGGFHRLKDWLALRKPFFLGQAGNGKHDGKYNDNADAPKGILLLGVQGCGKSLAAKAVAGSWGVPLLKLDFGALFNKYVGESERNVREALKSAELLSPCVLWIDEIEKSISSGNDDTGAASRILGTLLTWMAENQSRVFIVATSNDIEALPPELVRKGRIDEIFFVDLPESDVREDIFTLHIEKRGFTIGKDAIAELVSQSAGFSGAEIEQAVVAARYRAHAASETVEGVHILTELEQTRPLSVVRRESIDRLRRWAQGRTVSV